MDAECGWCEKPIAYDHVHDISTVGITINGQRFQIHERCFEEIFGEFGKKSSGELHDCAKTFSRGAGPSQVPGSPAGPSG
jgi:hypothetical protein